MEFKVGEEVGFIDDKYPATYLVVSEDETEFWLRSRDCENVFLKYPASTMKKLEPWRKSINF